MIKGTSYGAIVTALCMLGVGCGEVTATPRDGGDSTGGQAGESQKLPGHGGQGGETVSPAGDAGTSGSTGGTGAGGSIVSSTGGSGGQSSPTGTGGQGTGGSATGGSGSGGSGSGGSGSGGQGLLLGPNLISNGDFSNGQTGWILTAPSGSGITTSATDGQLCVSFPAGAYQEATVGWPADATLAIALPAGEHFQFSFQASSTPSLAQFQDLVGPATNSFGPDFQSTNDSLFGGIQMFSHTFTSVGDSGAGVAFNLNSIGAAATVCFDNVALQQVNGVSN